MSEAASKPEPDPQASEPGGSFNSGKNPEPNLILLYSLLALGLLAAMACAAAIVWPFYVRR